MLSYERLIVPEIVLQVVRCSSLGDGPKRRCIEPEREEVHGSQDHQDHLEKAPQERELILWIQT